MHYYNEHNIVPKQVELPLKTDTVMIHAKLHLKQVAEVLGIPIKHLRDLNPQYRYDIIPGQIKPYALRLPDNSALNFIDLQDSIYAYKDSVFFNSNIVQKPVSGYSAPQLPGKDYVKLTYTVKSGDAVGLIAEWYNIRSSDLRYWNNIRRNLIRSGQKLSIYKHKKVASKYRDINKLTYSEKQARIGKVIPKTNKEEIYTNNQTGDFIFYTVRSGDTLWEIAQKYNGVSDTDIMRLNNISNAGKIKPGQKLKIKPKS